MPESQRSLKNSIVHEIAQSIYLSKIFLSGYLASHMYNIK